MLSDAYVLYKYSALYRDIESLNWSADVVYHDANDYVMVAHSFRKVACLRKAKESVSPVLMNAQEVGVKMGRENALPHLQISEITDNKNYSPVRQPMVGREVFWSVKDMWNTVE